MFARSFARIAGFLFRIGHGLVVMNERRRRVQIAHIACISEPLGDSNFACEMVTTLLGSKIGIQRMKDSVEPHGKG